MRVFKFIFIIFLFFLPISFAYALWSCGPVIHYDERFCRGAPQCGGIDDPSCSRVLSQIWDWDHTGQSCGCAIQNFPCYCEVCLSAPYICCPDQCYEKPCSNGTSADNGKDVVLNWGVLCNGGRYDLKWDGSEGKPVACDGYVEYESDYCNRVDIIDRCESACGAPSDLDETSPSFSAVKGLSCPSSVTAGQSFTISFSFKGTGASYPYEVVSLYRGTVQEACSVYDQTPCTWKTFSKSLVAPGTNQCSSNADCNDGNPCTIDTCVSVYDTSYTYYAKSYGASSNSTSYCGSADGSQSCTISVYKRVCQHTNVSDGTSCGNCGRCSSGVCLSNSSLCTGNCDVCSTTDGGKTYNCAADSSLCTGNCDACTGSGTSFNCTPVQTLCTGNCDVCTGSGTSFNCQADSSLCTGNCDVCTGSGTSFNCQANASLCTGNCDVCIGSGTSYNCSGDNTLCANTAASCFCSGSGTSFNCQSCSASGCCDATCSNYTCGKQPNNSKCPSGQVCTASCTCSSVTCSSNSDCNDSNPCTTDTCVNPGTPSAYCSYSNVATCTPCSGSPYCSGSNRCGTSAGDTRYYNFHCSGGSCVAQSSENCRCDASDTDGTDYQTQGTCTDYTGCSGGSCQSNSFTDSCQSSTLLREYYVSGSGDSATCSYTDYNCTNLGSGYTCSGGKCVPPSSNCGNGSIDSGEQCELPNTSNNTYCPQTTSYCDYTNRKYCTRDSYGNCNSSCQCVADSWSCGGTDDSNYCNNCTHCGDGVCNCGENSSTCLADCVAASCPSTPSFPSGSWDRVWCDMNFSSKLADNPDQPNEQFDDSWGTGLVGGIQADNISFRSGRTIYLDAGTYTFYLGSDDGSRLWVDGSLCVDNWGDHGYQELNCSRTFSSAGNHQIRIDWYENGGDARVRFYYNLTPPNQQPTAAMSCQITGYCPGCQCDGSWVTYYGETEFRINNASADPDNNITKSTWSIIGYQDPWLTCPPDILNPLCDLGIIPAPVGNYNLKLRVDDAGGLSSEAYHSIQVKRDIDADFRCSLDNTNWVLCQNLSLSAGQIVYVRDVSSASDGASINSRIWKKGDGINFQIFAQNTITASTTLDTTNKVIRLEVSDTALRSDSQNYTLNVSLPLPKWREVPPIIWIEKFFAAVFSFFDGLIK